MRIAAFENEPEAAATATTLRDQGYDSKLIFRDDRAYARTLKEYFAGKSQTYEPFAFVISDDAEFEPFMRIANRHYGFVIRGVTD
jgi:hypothetical protein